MNWGVTKYILWTFTLIHWNWNISCELRKKKDMEYWSSYVVRVKFWHFKFVYTENVIFFFDLCRCSIWTLSSILYESIWNKFPFRFRANINEPLKPNFSLNHWKQNVNVVRGGGGWGGISGVLPRNEHIYWITNQSANNVLSSREHITDCSKGKP